MKAEQEKEDQKPLDMAQKRYEEKMTALDLSGYFMSAESCTTCIRTGVECWRPNTDSKKSRKKSACLGCSNGKKSCKLPTELGVGGMNLTTELGELSKYLRRDSAGLFPAPSAPLEDNATPENVDQLLVATLVAVRSLREEQHMVRSDIAELKLLVQAQSQRWERDMGAVGGYLNDLPTATMMEPVFKKVGELVLDTTSEVKDARASIEQLIAQGIEKLQSGVGGSARAGNHYSN